MATNRSRKQVRESRALGLALTPKAVRYFEKRPYGPGEPRPHPPSPGLRLRRSSEGEAASARPVRHP